MTCCDMPPPLELSCCAAFQQYRTHSMLRHNMLRHATPTRAFLLRCFSAVPYPCHATPLRARHAAHACFPGGPQVPASPAQPRRLPQLRLRGTELRHCYGLAQVRAHGTTAPSCAGPEVQLARRVLSEGPEVHGVWIPGSFAMQACLLSACPTMCRPCLLG
jgi:hypothetical protein